MPDYFQVDLALTSWRPSCLKDLVGELGRAFEREVPAQDVEFIGIDASKGKKHLASDEDLQGFCCTSTEGEEQEQNAEADTPADTPAPGVIKVALPEAVAMEFRQPKRLSVLAQGRQISKYSCEVRASSVEFSLKVFDCGHFKIKEANIGSSSPSAGGGKGAVLEGRWEELAEGVRLEFLLCYTCNSRRRPDDSVVYRPPPSEMQATMLAIEEEGRRLRGHLPSSLASDPVGEVVLQREADVVTKHSNARSQVDDDDDWETREMLKPHIHKRPPTRQPPPRPKRHSWEDDWESDEPTWPMYLGIFLFIFIFVVFAWLWYEEKYSTESQKEFDEL